ncbi:hypothetical protein HMPREF0262_02971 [Clostridium sp. ATCC 29733]|nr:hypothetical protein HMPREF0262_02971 [Clostridium sp. ATCC 29733]
MEAQNAAGHRHPSGRQGTAPPSSAACRWKKSARTRIFKCSPLGSAPGSSKGASSPPRPN